MPLWMLLSAVPAVAPPAAPPALPDVNTVCHVQLPPDLLAIPDPQGDDLVYFAHVYELRGVLWGYADQLRHSPPKGAFDSEYLTGARACSAAVRAHLGATPAYRGDATLRDAELTWLDGFDAAIGAPADRVRAALDAIPPSAEDLRVVEGWATGFEARMGPLDAAATAAEHRFAAAGRILPPDPRPSLYDCPTWPAPPWVAGHDPQAVDLYLQLALNHFEAIARRVDVAFPLWSAALQDTNPLSLPARQRAAQESIAAERAWLAETAPLLGFTVLDRWREVVEIAERALGPDTDRWLELSLRATRTKKESAEFDALTEARTVVAPKAIQERMAQVKANFESVDTRGYNAWITAHPCPEAPPPEARPLEGSAP